MTTRPGALLARYLPTARSRWILASASAFAGFSILSALGAEVLSQVLVILCGTVLAITLGTGHLKAGPRVRSKTRTEVGTVMLALYLVISGFAALYQSLSKRDAGAFTEPLSRVDAWYFTLTTFSTTGFGDITASSEAARVAVSAQMIVGLGIAVVVFARVTRSLVR